jgi:hypothetical protein
LPSNDLISVSFIKLFVVVYAKLKINPHLIDIWFNERMNFKVLFLYIDIFLTFIVFLQINRIAS